MCPIDTLRTARNDIGLSREIPITHLNSPTVFESFDGMLGSTIRCQGIPFITESNDMLNMYSQQWHRALMGLDERFCVYVTLHRYPVNKSLAGEFGDGFSQQLNRAYLKQLNKAALYQNDIYITVIYKGLTTGKLGKGLTIWNRLSRGAIKSSREGVRRYAIPILHEKIEQLTSMLSRYKPTLLGTRDDELGYSEVLYFLSIINNAGRGLKLQFAEQVPVIANGYLKAKESYRRYPKGNIAQYLNQYQVFFGKDILFQGVGESDKRYAAIVSIKQYIAETHPMTLSSVLKLDSELVSTHSFAFEQRDLALEKMQVQQRQFDASEDAATGEINDLSLAQEAVASQQLKMGYHHNTLMVLADTQAELEERLIAVSKAYNEAGFVVVRERIGQEAAYFAQTPMNMNKIARSGLITSRNFVDFCPLHNYPTGYLNQNHLGEAVTLLTTPLKTPFYFNFHLKGSKDNPSKGHTVIFGGNNSGKTVLMSFLDSQLSRYDAQTFLFDRDRGQEIYIRATGNPYIIISPEKANQLSMNPLLLEDTDINRQFCYEWLGQLVKRENENEVPANIQRDLNRCVDYAFDSLSTEYRHLSHAVSVLPVKTFERWPELSRWLRGSKGRRDGQYAYLFDNEEDTLSLNHRKVGFDITHLLDKEPMNVVSAVQVYLFHRITQTLTKGRLTSIVLDEGAQYLRSPYWVKFLSEKMPTIRKLNGFIVFATQSPRTVVESELAAVFQDNAATFIYFANPQADKKIYQEGLQLTDSEYSAIRNNDQLSRLFLLKQENDSTLCKLDLSGLPHELQVLSSNANSVNKLDKLCEQYGHHPDEWLPHFYE